MILQINKREVINFALELLVWQDMDIQFCMFLQDIFINLLKSECSHNKMILVALTPLLAEAIKWIILNGYNPTSWIVLLSSSIQIDHTALSVVLYILADVVVETSSLYITTIIDVCE